MKKFIGIICIILLSGVLFSATLIDNPLKIPSDIEQCVQSDVDIQVIDIVVETFAENVEILVSEERDLNISSNELFALSWIEALELLLIERIDNYKQRTTLNETATANRNFWDVGRKTKFS